MHYNVVPWFTLIEAVLVLNKVGILDKGDYYSWDAIRSPRDFALASHTQGWKFKLSKRLET